MSSTTMQQDINLSSASLSLSIPSPSFTTYSSQNLADIAARVIHELNLNDTLPSNMDPDDDVEPEPEFEFVILPNTNTSSPISADDIFHNGQIKPIYPLFNAEVEVEVEGDNAEVELEGVPQETYCVWSPKKKQEENNNNNIILKNKSNSTGTSSGDELSKRWRLRDVLLNRSHSDGKDNTVFLPSNNSNSNDKKVKGKVTAVKVYGKKNGEVKKKTYLTYRPELVGFFW